MAAKNISRKGFLTRTGGLVVAFSFTPAVVRALTAPDPARAGATTVDPTKVDAWLAINPDSSITIYCGKVELGTGVQTALTQIVAEELYLNPATYMQQITFVQGDTSLTPNQGYTAGSQTIQSNSQTTNPNAGFGLRPAAATAFQQLLTWAGSMSNVLSLQGNYGPLVQSHSGTFNPLQIPSPFNQSWLKSPSAYTIVGQPAQRVDLPGKFTGQFTYMQDFVVPGMKHGRVVRPAGRNATLVGTPSLPSGLAGNPQVYWKGNFVGVVADDEWSAIQAASQLNVTWQQGAPLAATYDGTPASRQALIQALQNPANIDDSPPGGTVLNPPAPVGNVATGLAGAAKTLQAAYFTPYHMHAAIGPSCGVANVSGGQATVWSGTQGVNLLQGAIAQLLGLPTSAVHVIYVEASGCYGHNGADDAAADAALLSQLAGVPVRVQWMRPEEHGWEPLGPAMVHAMQGGLDATGNVVAWGHALWTQTHSTRPGGLAGNLLAGQELGFQPQGDSPVGANLGGRNSGLNYAFPNYQVTGYNVINYTTAVSVALPGGTQTTNVLPRTTALRTLGGLSNTFANESFMDELAIAAKADPLAFRKKYLSDTRALAVLNAMASQAGWGNPPPAPPPTGSGSPPLLLGRGISYVQYENTLAYVAAYAEVLVNLNSGAVQVTRVVIAHDCGLIINPDGLKNQIEGNVVQAASRALKEEVLFDANGVTSKTWAGAPAVNTWSISYVPGPAYQIFHFNEVPSVEIVLNNQPTQPALGSGEPVSEAIPAVIGNAIYNATKLRLRNLPFSPANVLAALNPSGTSGQSSIAASWGGQTVVSGDYLWFNGHLKLTNVPQNVTYPIIITVTSQQITGDGGAGATASAPSATIIISSSASIDSAVFGNGQWTITVPSSDVSDDEILFGGLALPVSNSAWNTSRNVTWKATFASNTPGIGVQWVWSAAQYKQPGFSANTPPQASDYTNLMVKPTHHGTEYNNGDHAGTPENTAIKALLVTGPRGGAGSNYTGGWSGTAAVSTLGSIGS